MPLIFVKTTEMKIVQYAPELSKSQSLSLLTWIFNFCDGEKIRYFMLMIPSKSEHPTPNIHEVTSMRLFLTKKKNIVNE